jgi:hypothetical protein
MRALMRPAPKWATAENRVSDMDLKSFLSMPETSAFLVCPPIYCPQAHGKGWASAR